MFKKEFETIFQYAIEKVEDIEILLTSFESFSSSFHDKKIDSLESSETRGIGVRVINKGKLGYAYTENFSEEMLRKVVDQAKENAFYSEEDIIEIGSYPDNQTKLDLYNQELEHIKNEDAIQVIRVH